MSFYFACGKAASRPSRHHQKNADGLSKHEIAWLSQPSSNTTTTTTATTTNSNSNNNTTANMPNGFPAFPQSRFPNDKPPTLLHPASPKQSPADADLDGASMMSTSTFASSISLLKQNVKSALSSKDKESARR